MDRRNKSNKSSKAVMKTNKIYMDLKEILREHALRYLPAKALHRSLTVCRDWKLQISTPFFVHNQSNSFRSFSGLFYQSSENPPSFLSLDQMAYGVPDPALKFLPEPVDVKASSNGLLCCQGRTGERAYYVCNPVNKHWKKLPKPSVEHGSDPALVLVFEPSVLNFVAEYKLVCIVPSSEIDEAYEFEIYSSAQNSWKLCAEMFFSKRSLQLKPGIYMNGVAYWPMCYGKLMCFDMKKERATEISGYCFFNYDFPRQASSALGEWNGKLCVSYMQGLSIKVSVMETAYANTMPMRSNTRTWVTKQQVQLNAADLKLEGSDKPRVLLTWGNVTVLQVGSRVFSHDLKTHKTTALGDHAGLDYSSGIFPYVNSLVSLI